MGSHYIPVGKIKIDKDILDIVCPAAGYSETPPPPEIYCPVNGYEQIIPDYIPDEDIPEVNVLGEQQIILICSKQLEGSLRAYVYSSGTNYGWEIYGDGDILIDSGTQNNGNKTWNFNELTGGYGTSGIYFKLIIKPFIEENIVDFRVYSYNTVYPIIEAYINAPYIEKLNFYGSKLLKKAWLCETMDSLDNTSGNSGYMFRNTISLEEVTMPTSMASATNMDWWFAYSSVPEVVLPANMPSCTSISNIFNYAETKKVTLPTNAIVTGRMDYSFANMANIKELVFTNGFSSVTGRISAYQTFLASNNFEKIDFSDLEFANTYNLLSNLKKLKFTNNEVTIKVTTDSSSFYGIFTNLIQLKKITIIGDGSNMTGAVINFITGCLLLEELILPNNMTLIQPNFLLTVPSLKKVTLSDEMPNLASSTYSVDYLFSSSSCINVEEVSTCNDWGSEQHGFVTSYLKKLKVFNQPTLKLWKLDSYQGSLEYIEVDWVNSTFTTGIRLNYNQLDASELNRIFTALPNMSQTITVTGNPGAATCNPAIAEAKGWTVVT